MPLKIIVGRAGSGKSYFIVSEIKKLAERKEKAVYIVPEQFSHEAESSIISEVGYVSEDILATSFKRFAHKILKKAGKSGIYADNRVKSMIMAKALLELTPELKIFSSASKNTGYIECLLDVISEFKKAVIMPDDVIKCSEEIQDNDFFMQKMSELGKIYKKYTENFANNIEDSLDTITVAAEQICEKKELICGKIFIDGFYRFTKQEMLFIKALIMTGAEVVITVCADKEMKEGGVFESARQNIERFKEICHRIGEKDVEIEYISGTKRFLSKEISHLESEFTKYPPIKYEKKTEAIKLSAQFDIYNEILSVAAKISSLVKKEGYLYNEIGIIAGNFDAYKDIVPLVFSDYDIPVFVDDKKSVLMHPVVLMLFSVFDVITGGFSSKDILTYVKTGLSRVTQDEADLLENHIIESGIKNNDWIDDERFVLKTRSVFDATNELTDDEKSKLLEIKSKIINPIVRLKNGLSKSRFLKDRVDCFLVFFDETMLYENIVKIKDELSENGDRKRAMEYVTVYEIIYETFLKIKEFIGETQMGMDRMKTVIAAGFGDLSIGVVPTECEQVFLGDENRSVVKNIRALFVMGANTGAFPQEIAPSGIFTDKERLYLLSQGFQIAPDSEKRVLDSRFLVYNILSVPKEKLYISYALSDNNGKGLRPSQMIANIKRLFPHLTADAENEFEGLKPEYVTTPKSAFNYIVSKMAKASSDELLRALFDKLTDNPKFAEKLYYIDKRIKNDYLAERLERDAVEALYGKTIRGSVSRFEAFSKCPFSYFVEYGLRAKERKNAGANALDTGSLLHTVIEIFSKRVYSLGKSFSTITDSECITLIDVVIDELISGSLIEKLYGKNRLLSFAKRIKTLAGRSALAICDHVKMGKFEPCAFEFEFGENGDSKPIKLTMPNGNELSIIGKIDRVDKLKIGDRVYIKIIDYKSGEKKFSLADIYNKLSLQLTVYLTAYIKEEGNRTAAGMFYFKLTDPVSDVKQGIASEKAGDELLKGYKMSGLVLNDEEIIDAMEECGEGRYKSIPIMRKKDGEISQSMSSCASRDNFDVLKKYVDKVLCDIGEEIFNGNTDISPIKNGTSLSCDYCRYSSVCGAGKYTEAKCRNALSPNKSEIFEEMKKEV